MISAFPSRQCGKRFYTKHGYILTLHFVHLVAAENDKASLEIRDGSDANARLIQTFQLNNYTRPESVVTTGNNLFLVFRAEPKTRTEVFFEVTAGQSKAVDLNVTNTLVESNQGRGIWVEHMRSAVHVHKSVVKK